MKKIILSAIVAVCAISANAQVWAGGSLGFNAYSGDSYNETYTNLTIAPEIGYSINEKLDVAAAIGLTLDTNIRGTKDLNKTTFFVQPYARYTFAEAGIAKFFIDGYVTFGSEKYKGQDAETAFGVGVRPGVKVELADNLNLVAKLGSLGYYSVKDDYNRFGFNVDSQALSYGLFFNF